MDAPTRAPGYDLFKLIVAILLLILALVMMWTSTPSSPASTSTPPPPSEAASLTSSPPLTSTPPPPSETASLTSSPPLTSTPPPPNTTASPTPLPLATKTSEPIPAPALTPAAAIPVTACEAAVSRSRLQAGTNATLLRRLNFRSSPGIRDNWLRTNLPGTQVRIVGGPECVPYWTGAYLWWQIELPDGSLGWSAESSLHGSFYFIEPNP